jgi:hypothetical protein
MDGVFGDFKLKVSDSALKIPSPLCIETNLESAATYAHIAKNNKATTNVMEDFAIVQPYELFFKNLKHDEVRLRCIRSTWRCPDTP